MKRRRYIIFTIITVILAFLNIKAANSSRQLDFSRNKVHSISPATKNILQHVNDPITIKIFLSKKLPPEALPLRSALISLLNRYRQLSKGKIHLEFLNPDKNTAAKEDAEKLGILPIEFSTVSHDQLKISRGYFAASVSFSKKEKIIPLNQILANLEYNLSASILEVTRKKPKTIGWAADFQAAGPDQLPIVWKALQQIGQPELATLANLKKADNFDALIIIRPESKLSENAKKNLDHFLQTGHGVLLLNSKYQISSQLTATAIENGLNDLLKHYGFQSEKGFILDKEAATASFRGNQGQTLLTLYPFWPIIKKKNINQRYAALANLNEITLFWPTPLSLSHGAQPLLETGPDAWISQSQNLLPYNIRPPSKTANYVVAGYQDKAIPSYYHPREKHRIRLAVVSNSGFINNQSLYSRPQNITLFLDLVDLVTNDSRLAQIRNKTVSAASIRPLNDKQRETVRILDLAAPLVLNFLLAGGYWLWQRKIKRH